MLCCKHAKKNKENGAQQSEHDCRGGLKHILLMIVCCMAPIGAVWLLKISGYEGVASYLVFLLCPLMHLFMMKRLGHKNQESASDYSTVK